MTAAHTRGQGEIFARQEAEIRQLASRGVLPTDIAAAVGCALARVQRVLATPPAPPPSATRPLRGRAHTTSIPHLLELAAAHDDPRIARLGGHITGDVATLRDLLAAEDDRAAAAAVLIAADARTAGTWHTHDQAHRRRTDPTGGTA